MISPVGTILTQTDNAMSSAVTSLVGLVSQQLPGPLGVGVVLLFVYQGVLVAKGSSLPLKDLPTWLGGFAIVFWLITSPTTYLYLVRDVIFTGFPAALITGIAGGGTAMVTPAGVGAVLDSMFGQVWNAAAMVGAHGAFDVTGAVQQGMALLLATAAGVALAVCGAVYEICRFFLNIEVVLGPVIIANWPFPAFRHYVHSWQGVGVSLILAEVVTFIVAKIALLSCQPLMAQMTNALITSINSPGAAVEVLECLVSMGIVLWTAAAAVVAVPMITFFIGRGGSAPTPLGR